MLSLKHCSGPVDPKFKIFFSSPVKGAQNQRGGRVRRVWDKSPNISFSFFLKPPLMENNFDNSRPSNGMFITVPNNFKNIIDDVSPNYWRLQAVILNCSNIKLLLINSYFPVDPKTRNFDDSELLETLGNTIIL